MFFRILTLAAGILCAALAPTFVSAAEQMAAATTATQTVPRLAGVWSGKYQNTCFHAYGDRILILKVSGDSSPHGIFFIRGLNLPTEVVIGTDGILMRLDYDRRVWQMKEYAGSARLEASYSYV